MNNDVTWFLVGDASRARLFSSRGRQAHLNLVQSFDHPEGRASNQELTTDRPGRTHQSVGTGKSAMEPQTTPKQVEQRHFGQLLTEALRKGLDDQAYQHLVLVAPPHFLGLLRELLPPRVQQVVRSSLDKDYTALDVATLAERLAPVWDPIAAAG